MTERHDASRMPLDEAIAKCNTQIDGLGLTKEGADLCKALFAGILKKHWKAMSARLEETERTAFHQGTNAAMEVIEKLDLVPQEETGNGAKMREALIAIKREIDGYCNNGESLLTRMTEDPPDYTCLRDSILEINKLITAALAAPPRNCDREECRDFGESCNIFDMEVPDSRNLWGEDYWCEIGKWLLAPATEKKGGNDGNK